MYTFPFTTPDREPELASIAASITRHLKVGSTLFNAELREDSAGDFRVVEFSTRISGGHVYRNIKDVHRIDLVRMFARMACGDPGADGSPRIAAVTWHTFAGRPFGYSWRLGAQATYAWHAARPFGRHAVIRAQLRQGALWMPAPARQEQVRVTERAQVRVAGV